MSMKIHNLQSKKQQYRKHLQRLTGIYDKQRMKRKVLTQFKSVDKLMNITHKLHQSSNKFRFKQRLQKQKQQTVRDWSFVNSSILTSIKRKQNKEHKQSGVIQKNNKEGKQLMKQNKNFFFRLMKVKPTIYNQKKKEVFGVTQRSMFRNKFNQTEMDFSSILQASIINHTEEKRISVKLHNFNEQVIKIKFSQQIREIFHPQKLYFAQVKCSKDLKVQSCCFSSKELLQSQFYIYKKMDQKIQLIEIKQLYNDMKSITKGYFLMDTLEQNKQNGQQFLEFVFSNKKVTAITVHIQRKKLKKRKKLNSNTTQQNTNTQQNTKVQQLLSLQRQIVNDCQ